ncbi:GroES-like protein [Agrocybe pediades]|nr:GroES-like protein [Agrocybe pediades]
MPPSTQKALFLDKKFGDLAISETEVYKPGPGEILIKIQATSLNPVDWKIKKYGMYIEEFPTILGTDIAGDVVELGEGVTDLKVGDRVFCQGRYIPKSWCSFQQYALGLADLTAKIPSNLTYEKAAALPVALSAAYIGLYQVNPHGLGLKPPVSEETRDLYDGVPIVVMGGSSSVGQLVLRLAKFSGFSPVITTASLKHTDSLVSAGATHVLDRSLPIDELISEIKKIAGDEPVQYVYDSIASAATQQVAFGILGSGGQAAFVGRVEVAVPEGVKAVAVLGGSYMVHNLELMKRFWREEISGWLEKGIIKANNVEVLSGGLAGIPDGLARMEADKVSGLKLVSRPQETA